MKNQARRKRHTQSGSIFFWIFFMVIMFAALSFALTQGLRGSTSTVDREKDKLIAQEIVEYLNQVKVQFSSLVISGCSPLEISFDSPVYVRYNGSAINTAPPSSPSHCAMFEAPSGITAISFSQYESPDYGGSGTNPLPGGLSARYVDGDNIGSAEHDLTVAMAGMDLNVCVAVLNYIASNGDNFTTVPTDTWGYGGNDSFTIGATGTLNELTLPTNSMIWALRQASSPDYCQLGMIIKAN
jgi:hypothetical protein